MVFVYKDILVGGAETLIYRIAVAMKKKGFVVSLCCNSIADEMKKLFQKQKIEINVLTVWTGKELAKRVKNQRTIFFSMFDFFSATLYLKKKSLNNILYIVHPLGLQLKKLSRIKMIQRLYKFFFRDAIYKYIYNGQIIFMDEMCIEWTEKYFNKKIENKLDYIFRLPMEPEEKKESKYNVKEQINLLTVARADFPFKGYIKGLIADTTELNLKGYNVNLTIVSYGDGEAELSKWIDSAKQNGCKKINWIGQTNNDELINIYRGADIYVGMGTTILEASRLGVVSIVVKPYTYDFEASGFFNENPLSICADGDTCKKGKDFILQIAEKSGAELRQMADRSYDAFVQFYSMDSFIERLDSRQILTSKVKKNIVIKLFILMWDLSHRKRKKHDR